VSTSGTAVVGGAGRAAGAHADRHNLDWRHTVAEANAARGRPRLAVGLAARRQLGPGHLLTPRRAWPLAMPPSNPRACACLTRGQIAAGSGHQTGLRLGDAAASRQQQRPSRTCPMPGPGMRAGPCAAVRPMLNVDSWGDLDTPQGFAVDLPAVDCDGAEPAMLIDVPWPGFHAPGLEALSGSLDSSSTGETLRARAAAAAALGMRSLVPLPRQKAVGHARAPIAARRWHCTLTAGDVGLRATRYQRWQQRAI